MSGEDKDLDFGDKFESNDKDPAVAKEELERKELEGTKDESVETEPPVDSDVKLDEEKEQESLSPPTEDVAKDEVVDDKSEEKERSKVIPRERFDAAQRKAAAREEALQAKIEELQKSTSTHKLSTDFSKLQEALNDAHDKYEDAVIEGDKAKARQCRAELMQVQDAITEIRTNVSADAAKRETITTLKYDAALAKAESEHPELNPDSDQFDAALTDEVGVLLEAFVLKGFQRDAALSKAVRYVVGDAPKKDPDNFDSKKIAAERATEARKKAASAAAKQPANTNKTGLDSDKAGNKDAAIKDVDILRMTQERFAKIDEETLARLRGDVL